MRVYSKATGVAVELPEERVQTLLDAGNFQKTEPKQRATKATKAEDGKTTKATKAS